MCYSTGICSGHVSEMGRKGALSQPGFDQKLFDDLMREGDPDLFYRINGLDPYAYLKDVLERLPTHAASRIDELLPHRWKAP